MQNDHTLLISNDSILKLERKSKGHRVGKNLYIPINEHKSVRPCTKKSHSKHTAPESLPQRLSA